MNISRSLAEFVANTSFRDIPKHAIEVEKQSILDNIGIVYKREHIFHDCRNVYPLRYDFYLPDFNSVIEYQGQQHYKNIDYFGGQEGFKCRQTNDKIKREYCADKNISLLELPYSLSSDEIKKEIYTFCFLRDCLA